MQDTNRNFRPSFAEIVVISCLLVFFALTAFVRF